jgi:hypothetical protein
MVGTLIAGAVVVEAIFCLAGQWAACSSFRSPTATSLSCNASCWSSPMTMVIVQPDRRLALRLARPAPALPSAHCSRMTENADMTSQSSAAASVCRHSAGRVPFRSAVGIAWLLPWWSWRSLPRRSAPIGYHPDGPAHRPALAPGNAAHWLGTDELGRDVLSRLLQSIRVSLMIAFGATDTLGKSSAPRSALLPRKFRGLGRAARAGAADFQAALPFLIMSLAVLAFFGSSMVLLVCLMGFYGWERYARIARGLAISAKRTGLCEPPSSSSARRRRGLPPSHPAQRRLDPDRLDDADLPRSHPDGIRPVLPRPRRAAAR